MRAIVFVLLMPACGDGFSARSSNPLHTRDATTDREVTDAGEAPRLKTLDPPRHRARVFDAGARSSSDATTGVAGDASSSDAGAPLHTPEAGGSGGAAGTGGATGTGGAAPLCYPGNLAPCEALHCSGGPCCYLGAVCGCNFPTGCVRL